MHDPLFRFLYVLSIDFVSLSIDNLKSWKLLEAFGMQMIMCPQDHAVNQNTPP